MTPDRVALMQDERQLTYRELEARAVWLAHGLREHGVERGDRVAYLGWNSIALVEILFAVAKLGAVMVPLNTRLAAPETSYILADCAPRVLIAERGFDPVVDSERLSSIGMEIVTIDAATGTDPLGPFSDPGSDLTLDEPISLDELFMIQYTSGTTGYPKGVRLTHGNITWNVFNLLIDIDLGSTEVALVTAPLFHTAALNQVLFPILLKGGTALIEARWDADRALELIETHSVTMLFGVPSMYLSLLRASASGTADLSTLRHALCGGAPVPTTLLEQFREHGPPIIVGYGLTEASPGVTILRATGPGIDHDKPGSAGTPCFFTDVRLDSTDGAGDTGEILVHGPNVSPGYWNRPDATAATYTDGHWLHTGDLGHLDTDGYLYVADRLNDMYISGGENIYPAEVEQAIYTHTAVAECAVIGIRDNTWGEVGRAVVVVHPGAQLSERQLLDYLDDRIARYKIPKSVVFVDKLIYNASGKLMKTRIRQLHGAPADED
ncbi:acyl-CoA synthetase [Nocardia mexicana]|uniref:Fatty-acyl-CoA synthase n=1 Tax=Nocardia mexicana TaxID=279262 RepID=A0A370GL38_9NOCA|nr:long-chain fatty acid--CoA ligase [Nocardia mexicana]RDI44445.1 fatty-acyl-CoA synthase [Nocardia mexicana]